jgi:hypothetical protein
MLVACSRHFQPSGAGGRFSAVGHGVLVAGGFSVAVAAGLEVGVWAGVAETMGLAVIVTTGIVGVKVTTFGCLEAGGLIAAVASLVAAPFLLAVVAVRSSGDDKVASGAQDIKNQGNMARRNGTNCFMLIDRFEP